MISIVDILLNREESFYKLSEKIGVSEMTLKRVAVGGRVKVSTADKVCKYYKIKREDVKEFKKLYGAAERRVDARKAARTRYKSDNDVKNKVIYKPEPCRNKACPLNKKSMCINDVVLSGRAGCANKDVPKKARYKETLEDRRRIIISVEANREYIKNGKRRKYKHFQKQWEE